MRDVVNLQLSSPLGEDAHNAKQRLKRKPFAGICKAARGSVDLYSLQQPLQSTEQMQSTENLEGEEWILGQLNRNFQPNNATPRRWENGTD